MSDKILQNNTESHFNWCNMLSEEGKFASFPWQGILGQTADASATKINATIGQAFEEDGSPMVLPVLKKLIHTIPSDVFLYAPSHGRKVLRDIWKKEIVSKNPRITTTTSSGIITTPIIPTSIPIVTNGLTHGLYLAGQLFLSPNETIIIPDLMWLNYKKVFHHANIETFPFFDNGKFNIVGLKNKLVGENQKYVILLNFPNNPTGYSPTVDEVHQIIPVIEDSANRGNNIVVICDDAYFGLNYETDVFPESIFSQLAHLHERVLAVKVDGASKEMFAWGFRVGFLTYASKGMTGEIAKVLEDKTAGLIRGMNSSLCSVTQYLIEKALESEDFKSQKANFYEILKARYNEVKEVLQDSKYEKHFRPLPFNSGYFMCIQLHKLHAEDVRKRLLQQDLNIGVITIGENLLRIAYSSCKLSDLKILFENVYNACESVSQV